MGRPKRHFIDAKAVAEAAGVPGWWEDHPALLRRIASLKRAYRRAFDRARDAETKARVLEQIAKDQWELNQPGPPGPPPSGHVVFEASRGQGCIRCTVCNYGRVFDLPIGATDLVALLAQTEEKHGACTGPSAREEAQAP